jgi:hypothetical protein
MGNISRINSNLINADTASYVGNPGLGGRLNQNVNITGSLTLTGSFDITGSIFIASPIRGNVISVVAVSNTASIDFRTGTSFTLTLANTANTHIRPIGFSGSQTVNILVTQNSIGLGTANFPSYVKQPSGFLYTGSQVLSAIDVLTLTAFNSTNVYVNSVRNMV